MQASQVRFWLQFVPVDPAAAEVVAGRSEDAKQPVPAARPSLHQTLHEYFHCLPDTCIARSAGSPPGSLEREGRRKHQVKTHSTTSSGSADFISWTHKLPSTAETSTDTGQRGKDFPWQEICLAAAQVLWQREDLHRQVVFWSSEVTDLYNHAKHLSQTVKPTKIISKGLWNNQPCSEYRSETKASTQKPSLPVPEHHYPYIVSMNSESYIQPTFLPIFPLAIH